VLKTICHVNLYLISFTTNVLYILILSVGGRYSNITEDVFRLPYKWQFMSYELGQTWTSTTNCLANILISNLFKIGSSRKSSSDVYRERERDCPTHTAKATGTSVLLWTELKQGLDHQGVLGKELPGCLHWESSEMKDENTHLVGDLQVSSRLQKIE
jgi:hypothetical protein